MFNNNNNNNSNSDQSNQDNEKLEQFSKNLFSNLITATKISNNLPSEEDYSYYETFPQFRVKMNDIGKRLLNLTQNFVQSEDPKTNLSFVDTNDTEELSDRFNGIVDLVDGMIDKVDKTIDPKYSQNQSNIYISSTVLASQNNNNKSKTNEINMFYGSNISRPQSKFSDPVDNSNFPFLPKIVNKPNSMVDLDPIFEKSKIKEVSFGKIVRTKEQETIVFPHPYEYEIQHFNYTKKQTQPCKEILSRGLEETPYTWIENIRQLEELTEKLNHVEEIAIDLEHHNYRSYQGFVCLMQISTRTEDFIIDTLALRAHIQMLNIPFTNPNIVKVLHGSDSDIKWLQRDFGVYIVNMFDTGQASRVLEYPSASLAFLLKYFCGVDANKKYQLADWRIRPIPEEMIRYAREDTHYLLYIYDRLRNELFNKGKNQPSYLNEVLRRSRDLCLFKHEREILDATTHIVFAKKANLSYNAAQLNVLKAVYHWRENLAREEDESIRYVLPNQMMLAIVEKAPTTVQELLMLCNPVPPYIKLHAHAIIQEILKAKLLNANGGANDSGIKQPILNTGAFIPQLQSILSSQSNTYYQNSIKQMGSNQINQINLNNMNLNNTSIGNNNNSNNNSIVSPNLTSIDMNNISTSSINTSGRQSPVHIPLHANSSSPVLSTDQLYKTAKWLSNDNSFTSLDVNNLQPAFQSLINNNNNNINVLNNNTNNSSMNPSVRKSTSIAPLNQNNHSNTPISNTSLFDSSGEESHDDHERKKSRKIASMVASSFEPTTLAPTFKPIASLKSLDKQNDQHENNKDDDEDEDFDEEEEEEEEDDEEEEEEEEEEDVNMVTSQDNNTATKQSKKAKGMESDGEDGDLSNQVPKSMQEIYQLSNMNRRRNKEKKKLKENPNTSVGSTTTTTTTTTSGSSSGSSSLQTSPTLGNSSVESKASSKKDGENASVTDTFSFLKEIGWVDNEQTPDSFKPSNLNVPNHPSQSNQSGANNNNQNKVPLTKQSKQKQQHHNPNQQQQNQQQNQQQQQFVSFDYSNTNTMNTQSKNPNQQQNFFNLEYSGAKKKTQSSGAVRAKSECQWTIKNAYETADDPSSIFIGLVWQYDMNGNSDEKCFEVKFDDTISSKIKTIKLDYKEAKGPCYARSLAQSLYGGEKYCLQIDSHMRFIKGWDRILKQELDQCGQEDGKAILTCYPMGYTLPNKIPTYRYPILVVASHFGENDGMLRIRGRVVNAKLSKPVGSLFWVSGFSFSLGTVIKDVPYDPSLCHLFFGEETSMSLRLYTNGYRFYTPTQSIVFHLWSREHRPSFRENKSPETVAVEKKSLEKVVQLLTGECGSLDQYGLGSVNTLQDYTEYCGVDFKRQTITPKALYGGHEGDRDTFFMNDILEMVIKSSTGIND
ncbi:hypothetical protein CYY_008379 [Polysphondylium violaceum]|uniref:HRDC domain-containing protein n=1 Tax=Polysphondylium violaceum TaxID=133409 RepID=A0A8J4PN50_9MYCE|nr:hypothetical protein CYY_008379 [Polysphondylium violaceum]